MYVNSSTLYRSLENSERGSGVEHQYGKFWNAEGAREEEVSWPPPPPPASKRDTEGQVTGGRGSS